MSENSKVVKAGIGYTISNYFLKGLTFLTIPIFSRIMSTADYGLYNTFVAYESILFIFIGLAIHSSYKNARFKYGLVSEGIETGKDYNTYVSVTLLMVLTNSTLLLIIANICSGVIGNLLDLDRLSINLLILYSASNAILLCFNSDVALRYQFQSFLKISAFNAIGNILLSIVLMLTIFSETRYIGRVFGTTIPILAVAIFILLTYIKRARPKNGKEFLTWGIRYSLPIVPHGVSQVILSQFDRIMIKNMISASVAGIYSFAYNIYTIVSVTMQSLDSVWNTWFYEQMHQKNYDEIKEKSSLYMLGMLTFTSCIMLVSPEVIKILGPEEYWDASYCVIPIVAGGFFSFLYTLPSAIEYYYEKTKYIAVGTVSAAIVNIVLNAIFIQKYGYVAAAYTTLFTYLLYFSFHYLWAWKIQGSCLFNNKIVVFCIGSTLLLNVLALYFIDSPLVRIGIGVFIFSTGLKYEERKIGFLAKIIRKAKK